MTARLVRAVRAVRALPDLVRACAAPVVAAGALIELMPHTGPTAALVAGIAVVLAGVAVEVAPIDVEVAR